MRSYERHGVSNHRHADCLLKSLLVRTANKTSKHRITGRPLSKHDDVIKWKHFPRYWPFVRGIHRSPVNSPHKGQWHGALMFTLICARINGWVNNREADDLRRHRAHCDFIVMPGLPTKRDSNAESASITRYHHEPLDIFWPSSLPTRSDHWGLLTITWLNFNNNIVSQRTHERRIQ